VPELGPPLGGQVDLGSYFIECSHAL
jgi:hypothetical protein